MKWRPMRQSDRDDVGRIGNGVHLAHQEDPDVLIERQALSPEGCHVFETDEGALVGYLLSHPWIFAVPPSLDSFLGSLPEDSDSWYIHDLVLLPEARGHRAGEIILDQITTHARQKNFKSLSLIAISGADRYWSRLGFVSLSTETLDLKLASYGNNALFMYRSL